MVTRRRRGGPAGRTGDAGGTAGPRPHLPAEPGLAPVERPREHVRRRAARYGPRPAERLDGVRLIIRTRDRRLPAPRRAESAPRDVRALLHLPPRGWADRTRPGSGASGLDATWNRPVREVARAVVLVGWDEERMWGARWQRSRRSGWQRCSSRWPTPWWTTSTSSSSCRWSREHTSELVEARAAGLLLADHGRPAAADGSLRRARPDARALPGPDRRGTLPGLLHPGHAGRQRRPGQRRRPLAGLRSSRGRGGVPVGARVPDAAAGQGDRGAQPVRHRGLADRPRRGPDRAGPGRRGDDRHAPAARNPARARCSPSSSRPR